MELKVAVLGGGNGAHAVAADLSLAGVSVHMWEHPDFLGGFQKTLESGRIAIEGVARNGVGKLAKATKDIGEAMAGVDLILVVMPAFGQEEIARICAPHLQDGQTIILIPGNAGTFVFRKVFQELKVRRNLTLGETSTLPYATRLTGPSRVTVFNQARMIPLGVFPRRDSGGAVEKFQSLFPAAIKAENVIEAALNNPNPIVHAAGCLLNAGRIEYSGGEFYFYKEALTPAVGNLIRAMDEERMAIARALQLRIFKTRESSQESFLNTSMDVMFGKGNPPRADHVSGGRQKSPTSLQHRFITEDVPFGLVFMASLGRMIGVRAPAMEAGIHLFSIINQTDYSESGRNVEKLGIANLSPQALIRYAEEETSP